MNAKIRTLIAAMVAGMATISAGSLAMAGDEHGDFMIRLQGAMIDPDTDATVSVGGATVAGANAEASTEFVPTATLTYFLNNNLGLELLCCFSKHEIDGEGTIAGLNTIAETWIFPPALTLTYHFDNMGGFKPYIGAGLQYIAFFNEDVGDNVLGATSVDIDSALGFTLQAGIDVSLGSGWYLNADVKKTWLNTDVTWHNTAAFGGADVKADVDLDPLIVSAGLGYRFNLSDIFGARHEPLK